MKSTITKVTLLIALILSFSSQASIEGSGKVLLEVVCEEKDKNAKIYINGNFSAFCPTSLEVEQGDVNLIVVNPVDDAHEQVFVKSFYLYKARKHVKVTFPAPQLTAKYYNQQLQMQLNNTDDGETVSTVNSEQIEAIDNERFYPSGEETSDADSNANKIAHWQIQAKNKEKNALEVEAEKRKYAELNIERARTGDLAAMTILTELYTDGVGVDKNPELVAYWHEKLDVETAKKTLVAAKKGDLLAMEKMSELYRQGKGIEQNDDEAELWAKYAIAEKKAIVAQKKIDEIEYFQMTKGSVELAVDANDNMVSSNGSEGLLMSSTSAPITTSVGVMMDITSAPTKATQLNKLQDEISTRPSTHAKPSSMMSKAAKNKEENEK